MSKASARCVFCVMIITQVTKVVATTAAGLCVASHPWFYSCPLIVVQCAPAIRNIRFHCRTKAVALFIRSSVDIMEIIPSIVPCDEEPRHFQLRPECKGQSFKHRWSHGTGSDIKKKIEAWEKNIPPRNIWCFRRNPVVDAANFHTLVARLSSHEAGLSGHCMRIGLAYHSLRAESIAWYDSICVQSPTQSAIYCQLANVLRQCSEDRPYHVSLNRRISSRWI